VLTNQSGIGRGYYTEDDVLKLHKWMQEELASKGITLKHWYYCPYHPQAVTDHYKKDSPLRKPRSAMAEMAFADLDLDPRRCVMVGDKISDQLDHLDISTFFIKGKYDIPEDDKLIKNIGVSLFGY
jgi:D-glycero-D-manno-heptose 1,7-bisphosphate phosphatase